MPQLSVVMTVYNGGAFLSAAIESILRQTFSDFDFHIVDDGSTDATSTIVARYAALDRRVVVHTQPRNTGFVIALNRGCRAATGDLIARMDADDVSLPHRFAKQVAYMREHPDVGVLGTCIQEIDEQDHMGRVWPCPSQPGLTAWTMMFVCVIAHPTVMLRRALLEKAGFYPLGYTPVEDHALWMRLLKSTRINNLSEVLVYYRSVSTSMSRAKGNRLDTESERVFADIVSGELRQVPSLSDVRGLRALPHHRYPDDAEQIRRLGALIVELAAYMVTLPPFTADDVTAVRRDAGVRLLLLSAVAARQGKLALALRLAVAACRESPSSITAFGRKALGVAPAGVRHG